MATAAGRLGPERLGGGDGAMYQVDHGWLAMLGLGLAGLKACYEGRRCAPC